MIIVIDTIKHFGSASHYETIGYIINTYHVVIKIIGLAEFFT